MLKKRIVSIVVALSFLYPLLYVKGFAFPAIFPHVMFGFFISQILLLTYLLYSFSTKKFVVRKTYITVALAAYILVLFVSALAGSDFGQSFWSTHTRMTGIVTWLHFFAFFFVTSAFFERGDWKYVFRALACSGVVLAFVTLLGTDGMQVPYFVKLSKDGGSLLGNTSYNGAYLVLVFFATCIGYSLERKKLWKILYCFFGLFIFLNPDLFSFSVLTGDVSLTSIVEKPTLLLGLARASTLIMWGGILLVGILVLLHRIKKKMIVITMASGIIAIIFATCLYGVSSIMQKEGRVYDVYVTESGPARPIVWGIAYEGIKEQPLFGYGNGNFDYVYQEHLDPAIIHIENPEWFDKAHNFLLDELVGSGYVGTLLLFATFVLLTFSCFRRYKREGTFYFLFLPFIFVFHFLQMQTFFLSDSSLFLLFLFAAFIATHEDVRLFQLAKRKQYGWYQFAAVVLFVVSVTFFVCVPLSQNKLIPRIAEAKTHEQRMALYGSLQNLKQDPVEVLRYLAGNFTDETAHRAEELKQKGLAKNVSAEYEAYLVAYAGYDQRYQDNYRYLIEYANLINTGYMYGVGDLAKGEELLMKALAISDTYPHAYWLLAENLFYQGKSSEALEYAQKGYDLDPTIDQSVKVLEFITTAMKSKNPGTSYLYITNL